MKDGRVLVVIDPGHGGPDPGAVDGPEPQEKDTLYTREEELAYSISEQVSKILQASGFETLLTRSKDSFKSLQERCNIANKAKADLFVSIHLNSAANSSAQGFEVLHYPESQEGSKFANAVLHSLAKFLPEFRNRGVVPRGNLYVLKHTNMPAILVECGFISNPKEEQLLNNPDVQKRIAQAIAKGVELYWARR